MMQRYRSTHWYFRFAICLVLGISTTMLFAAKRSPSKRELRKNKANAETVDFFAAIESGDIEAKLYPKNAKTGKVVITNKTKKPLRIKLPEAFAGVPVAAQFGGGGGGQGGGGFGGGGQGGGQGGQGGGQQSQGGGFGGGGQGGQGGGGGGQGGGGGGGGFFNIGPEKVGKLKTITVCLEHGKPDPSPRGNYRIIPIEQYVKKPEVIELCKMLGTGQIDQASAQAAAWHLENGLSWRELVNKIGVKHLNGSVEMFFTRQQVYRATLIAKESLVRAKDYKPTQTGKKSSLSYKK